MSRLLEREFLHGAGERVCWRRGFEPRATRASETCTCRHELRAPRRRDTRGAVTLRGDTEKGSRNSHFLFIGFV